MRLEDKEHCCDGISNMIGTSEYLDAEVVGY
jgi:hypothetical protein